MPSEKSADVNSAPAKKPQQPFVRTIGLAVLSFISGLGGAWTYMDSGLIQRPVARTELQRVMAEGDVVADIAKQVSPSVVSVLTEAQTPTDTLFGRYYQQQQGAGTGIIISQDGYILTNKHVIPDGTTKVSIVANDGTTYSDVDVVGRDPVNDLAFLKVKGARGLVPAKLGDSSAMSVGGKVVAIGNALGEFQTTVTSGIISGMDRSITAGDEASGTENLSNLLQTDAAINPGNSGGPLVNLSGEVIGINTAVSQGAEGIGFAIPINEAKGLIKGVLATGKIQRGYLGVRYVMLNAEVAKRYNISEKNGAYIASTGANPAIVPDSPAAQAGLKEGDIIVAVNGREINEKVSLVSQLSQYTPGDTVKLRVIHDGQSRDVTVRLGTYGG